MNEEQLEFNFSQDEEARVVEESTATRRTEMDPELQKVIHDIFINGQTLWHPKIKLIVED